MVMDTDVGEKATMGKTEWEKNGEENGIWKINLGPPKLE